MLHISQIEKPRCSARIEKIRLRRATALPFASQNFVSSGFHSAIQVSRLLIANVLFREMRVRTRDRRRRRLGGKHAPPVAGSNAYRANPIVAWTVFGPLSVQE